MSPAKDKGSEAIDDVVSDGARSRGRDRGGTGSSLSPWSDSRAAGCSVRWGVGGLEAEVRMERLLELYWRFEKAI